MPQETTTLKVVFSPGPVPDLDEWCNVMIDAAKTALKTTGEVSPACLILTAEGLVAVGIEAMLGGELQKEVLAQALTAYMDQLHAISYLLITETWCSRSGHYPPSQDPSRTEALLVIHETRKTSSIYFLPITRDAEGRPTAGEPQPGHFAGRFTHWLCRDRGELNQYATIPAETASLQTG